MRNILRFLFVIVIIRFSTAQIYDFESVDNLLADSLDIYFGNVIVKIEQEGNSIYDFQTGVIEPNSSIAIASATKWLSGAVILSLAEDGFFSLDDSLGMYLPIFTENGKGHITIRQAFSMSCGMFSVEHYYSYSTDSTMTLAESVDSIAVNIPLAFEPGTWIAYNSHGMQTVGRIAEIVTDLPWQTIAEDRIFNKCEMFNTRYDVFGINPVIAGGARSSSSEYMKFLNMIMNNGVYNGEQVLSVQSIQEFFTNQTAGLPLYWSPFPYDHPDYPYEALVLRYGFGSWILAENPESDLVEEITSPGAWGTFPWADKKRNISGVIFTFVPVYLGGFERTLHTNLALINLVRQIIDSTGDVNQDGVVNILDAVFTISLILENEFNELADLNNDEIVDILDIVIMVSIILEN